MTSFDRRVRSTIYELLVDQERDLSASIVAEAGGWVESDVAASFRSLAADHRLVLAPDGRVRMAHPFSGVPTEYRASIADAWWYANCAWDALAVLSLLGDGEVTGPAGLVWRVRDGRVSPDGFVHLVVPARAFWDDVGFT